jgi:hypothetical protein
MSAAIGHLFAAARMIAQQRRSRRTHLFSDGRAAAAPLYIEPSPYRC